MSFDFNPFFQTYFVDYACRGYNIYNTITYGIIFAIAVFATYKLLKRLKLQIDRRFLIGIFPFIIMGSVLRVMEDAMEFSMNPKFVFLCSPIIYFVIYFIALFSLLFAMGIEKIFSKRMGGKEISGKEDATEKKKPPAKATKRTKNSHSNLLPGRAGGGKNVYEYWKIWFAIGLILDIIFLAMLLQNGIRNPVGFALVAVIAGIWAVIIFGFYKIRGKIHANWFTRFNALLLGVHMFDASTTFVALQYFSYYEQHVASNAIIDIVGPAGQFLLKLAVVPVVLYFLERELPKKEDENLKNFFKVAILILGMAPGLRNFLRLGLGV